MHSKNYLSEKAVVCLAKQFVQSPNAYTMDSKGFVGYSNIPLHLLCHDIPVGDKVVIQKFNSIIAQFLLENFDKFQC